MGDAVRFANDEELQPFEHSAIALSGIDGWRPWLFQKIESGILCTGAVCPPLKHGPRKGWPNFKKHDKKTKMTVLVPRKKADG